MQQRPASLWINSVLVEFYTGTHLSSSHVLLEVRYGKVKDTAAAAVLSSCRERSKLFGEGGSQEKEIPRNEVCWVKDGFLSWWSWSGLKETSLSICQRLKTPRDLRQLLQRGREELQLVTDRHTLPRAGRLLPSSVKLCPTCFSAPLSHWPSHSWTLNRFG